MRKKKPKFRKYVPKFKKSEIRRVESKNAVLELLEKGAPFIEIEIAHNAQIDPKTREIQRIARANGIPVRPVDRNVMNRQTESTSHESVVGILPKRESVSLKTVLDQTIDVKNRTFIILDGVSYAQNVGAILRTSYATGVDAVIIPPSKGVEINATVTRISMGASEVVPIIYMNSYSAITMLKKEGFKVFGVDESGDKNYFNEKIFGDAAFIFGSEAEGSSSQLLEEADSVIKLPMQGNLGSINVSVAVGVVLFEKIRQEK